MTSVCVSCDQICSVSERLLHVLTHPLLLSLQYTETKILLIVKQKSSKICVKSVYIYIYFLHIINEMLGLFPLYH